MNFDKVIDEMKWVFRDVPYGVSHTMRVLNNAELIMEGEAPDASTRERVILAAILHDIGALEAQRKHGSMHGQFQELEGPAIAADILARSGISGETAERVCYMVGHHHTFAMIDGLDFQILWEADLLDSLEFGKAPESEEQLDGILTENFTTPTGRALAISRLARKEK